jgi:lipopolysaccharide transport system permease protein
MTQALRELYGSRELLWVWTVRGIKARYQQTALGLAWAVFQPLALTLIYAVVFSVFIKVDTGGIPYPLFVYAGLLPWTLFASSITAGVTSLVQNMELVTKIYFPREVLPIASVGIPVVDFVAGVAVLLLFMVIYRAPVSLWLLLLPLLLALQVLFALGLVLIGSAANALLRDIGHAVPPVLLVWQFATPIIYPMDLVPRWLMPFYLLNPMAVVVDSYKRILLHGAPPQWGYLAIAALISVLVLALAYVLFKRAEQVMVDVI